MLNAINNLGLLFTACSGVIAQCCEGFLRLGDAFGSSAYIPVVEKTRTRLGLSIGLIGYPERTFLTYGMQSFQVTDGAAHSIRYAHGASFIVPMPPFILPH